eukprot:11196906-Lingulodinium_polyedra.AAC.1
MRVPENWRALGVRVRAISEPLRPRTAIATASLRSALQTLHNDAVKSAVHGRSGTQIARVAHAMRTPVFGARS